MTALWQLADHCGFANITTDEILRDRVLFGISDSRVCKSLLRKEVLAKVYDTCQASELSHAVVKVITLLRSVYRNHTRNL